MNQVAQDALTVFARPDDHTIDGVLVQIEDCGRSPNAVAFRHAANNHLDGRGRILRTEESAVVGFSEPFLAGSALQHLSLMLSVGACFDNVAVTSQAIMATFLVDASVLVDREHVSSPLRCACSIIVNCSDQSKQNHNDMGTLPKN